MKPNVSGMRVNTYGEVEVNFNDGHTAVFVPNTGGWGMPQALEAFRLEKEGRQIVVLFYSSYQRPINCQPFGFVQVATGYTVELIAEYWQAAIDYAGAEFSNGRLVSAWAVLCLGRSDIKDIQNGKCPLPTSD